MHPVSPMDGADHPLMWMVRFPLKGTKAQERLTILMRAVEETRHELT